MKKLFICVVVWNGLLFHVHGQDMAEKDAQMMDQYIHSHINVEKVKINSDTLSRVFEGIFYRVKPVYLRPDGTSAYCEEYVLAIVDGSVKEPELTSSDTPCKTLLSLIKSDFRLKGEMEAIIFETALDQLYPFGWPENIEDKKHFNEGDLWYFIRGDFMGSKKGFVLVVDADSRIIEIDYELEAIKNP